MESKQAHAKRGIIARVKSQEFVVGDKVRIKLGAISNKVRQSIKSNRSKMIVVKKYTPEVYTVTTIYRSHSPASRKGFIRDRARRKTFLWIRTAAKRKRER